MKKLMKNKKGFTLMEMLIVVAIIVILVAISIPVFTSQLTSAKEATDTANERAAKGMATTMYLSKDITFAAGETEVTYHYDAENGTLVKVTDASSSTIKGYSQATADQIVEVTITSSGTVTTEWIAETDTK